MFRNNHFVTKQSQWPDFYL